MASGLVEAEGLLPYQMTLGPDSPNISASISSRLFWGKISTRDKLTRQNKAWNCLGTKALLLPIFDLQGLFWNDQCLRLLQKGEFSIKENFALSKDQLCDWNTSISQCSLWEKMTGILFQCYETTKICYENFI